MRIILWLLLLSIPFFGKSQNWSPIKLSDKSNFSVDNILISNTLWVDSVVGNYFYINRIITKCPTCTKPIFYAKEMFLKNQEQFLGSHFTFSQDEIMFFTANNLLKYSLKLNSPINTNFIFDSVNQIGCKLVEKKNILVFNMLDSIKKFQLSNGEEIILSKTFGMLKFPKFGSNQYIALVGLQNQNLGKIDPKYEQFTKLQANDEFEYYEEHGGKYVSYICYQKFKVIKQLTNNPASYLIKTKKMEYGWLKGIFLDSIYSYYTDTLKMDFDMINYLDLYANMPLNINQCGALFKPVQNGLDSIFQCEIKYLDPLGFFQYNGDTIYSAYMFTNCFTNTYSLVFGKGIGMISMHESEQSGFPVPYKNKNLTAAKVGGIIYGNFSNNLYPEGDPMDQIVIFPNPSSGTFRARKFPTGLSTIRYTILNTCGKVVKTEILNNQTDTIDISNLANGIYIVRFESLENSTAKRLILFK